MVVGGADGLETQENSHNNIDVNAKMFIFYAVYNIFLPKPAVNQMYTNYEGWINVVSDISRR